MLSRKISNVGHSLHSPLACISQDTFSVLWKLDSLKHSNILLKSFVPLLSDISASPGSELDSFIEAGNSCSRLVAKRAQLILEDF